MGLVGGGGEDAVVVVDVDVFFAEFTVVAVAVPVVVVAVVWSEDDESVVAGPVGFDSVGEGVKGVDVVFDGVDGVLTFGSGAVNHVVVFLVVNADDVVFVFLHELEGLFGSLGVVVFEEVVDWAVEEDAGHGGVFDCDNGDFFAGTWEAVKEGVGGDDWLCVVANTVDGWEGSGVHGAEANRGPGWGYCGYGDTKRGV